jgi:hypothetical protein
MSLAKSLAAVSLAAASFGALASEVTFFVDPPSTRTRAEVIAELHAARASGELAAHRGEVTRFDLLDAIAHRAAEQRVRQAAAGNRQ